IIRMVCGEYKRMYHLASGNIAKPSGSFRDIRPLLFLRLLSSHQRLQPPAPQTKHNLQSSSHNSQMDSFTDVVFLISPTAAADNFPHIVDQPVVDSDSIAADYGSYCVVS
ncbi:unnamed protein product, partial [Mycena citricolor]